jgi:pSer/pThr/pTyr-binding forkhead associated (FHA) protein
MKDQTSIGRDSQCDLHLDWDGMSRSHAVIEGLGGDANLVTPAGGRIHSSFRVRDCGSSNGIYVNFVQSPSTEPGVAYF